MVSTDSGQMAVELTVCVEVETQSHKIGSDNSHFWSVDVTTEEDTRVRSRKLEAVN
jgi:hypothetical protein